MARVVEQFAEVRACAAHLRHACSRMMRIHILAHHTTGASWDTVAQVCFREQWDREMVKVADGFKPLPTWEERVTSAMRACKQDKHLTKEGVPIGPVCPRLAKRLFSANGSASAKDGRGRSFGGNNGRGSFRGRGGGRGGRRGGRGKENSKPGRPAAAAAAPAAAPGAAAAAAGGGG
jgi:uncharacterized membrane protein YgcG